VVGEGLDVGEVVARHDDGLRAVVDECPQCRLQRDLSGRVEPVERLVEDQDLGITQQRDGQRQPLAHAFGETGHGTVSIGESDEVEEFVDPS
jgi:hypothetical protein